MAVIKIFDPGFLGPGDFVEVVEATATKRTSLFTDGHFITLFGKFNDQTDATLGVSPVTRILESRDAEGTDPFIEFTGLKAKVADKPVLVSCEQNKKEFGLA